MSRLTLNNKAAQMIGKEDHLDDDDEWEDEEDGAPFQIGISPELQVQWSLWFLPYNYWLQLQDQACKIVFENNVPNGALFLNLTSHLCV